jgi:uncharacterized alkaline shock family protein YloU
MSDHEPNKYRSDEMEEAGRDDVVRVNDEVIATIAGTALAEVKGVASSAPGFVGGLLGRKGASRGIKIEADGNDVVVDVTIAVEYGARIPDVAAEIQSRLRGAIEEMTGKFVRAVNVTVQGIRAPSGAPGFAEPVDEDEQATTKEEPRQEG